MDEDNKNNPTLKICIVCQKIVRNVCDNNQEHKVIAINDYSNEKKEEYKKQLKYLVDISKNIDEHSKIISKLKKAIVNIEEKSKNMSITLSEKCNTIRQRQGTLRYLEGKNTTINTDIKNYFQDHETEIENIIKNYINLYNDIDKNIKVYIVDYSKIVSRHIIEPMELIKIHNYKNENIMKDTVNALELKIKLLYAALESYSDNIIIAKKEYEDLKNEINSENSRLKSLQDKIGNSEKERQEITEKIKNLKNEEKKHEQTKLDMENEKENYETLKKKNKKIKNVIKKTKELSENYDKLILKSVLKESEIHEKEECLKFLERKIEMASKDHNELCEKIKMSESSFKGFEEFYDKIGRAHV